MKQLIRFVEKNWLVLLLVAIAGGLFTLLLSKTEEANSLEAKKNDADLKNRQLTNTVIEQDDTIINQRSVIVQQRETIATLVVDGAEKDQEIFRMQGIAVAYANKAGQLEDKVKQLEQGKDEQDKA